MASNQGSRIVDDFGVGAAASRSGPGLSLAGLVVWIATIGTYYAFAPEAPMQGTTLDRLGTRNLVIAVVIGAFGTFAASILSALGMLLSLAERTHRPGRRAKLGVAGGVAGVAALLLVLIEIFRRLRAG